MRNETGKTMYWSLLICQAAISSFVTGDTGRTIASIVLREARFPESLLLLSQNADTLGIIFLEPFASNLIATVLGGIHSRGWPADNACISSNERGEQGQSNDKIIWRVHHDDRASVQKTDISKDREYIKRWLTYKYVKELLQEGYEKQECMKFQKRRVVGCIISVFRFWVPNAATPALLNTL